MSLAPSGFPALLPMGSPITSPQRKGAGQILTSPCPHPFLRATLQATALGLRLTLPGAGRGTFRRPSLSVHIYR